MPAPLPGMAGKAGKQQGKERLGAGLGKTWVDAAATKCWLCNGKYRPAGQRLRASRLLEGLKLRAGASPNPTLSRPPLLKPWAEPNSAFTPRAAPTATSDAQSV